MDIKDKYILYGGKGNLLMLVSEKSLLSDKIVKFFFNKIDILETGFIYDIFGIEFFILDKDIMPKEIILSKEESEILLKKL